VSVLTNFFAATPDELNAMSIEWGPVPPPPESVQPRRGFFGFGSRQAAERATPEPLGPTLEAVESTGIVSTQLGVLDEVATGTPYETLEQTGAIEAIVRDNGKDGPWVQPLRRELRDALAKVDGDGQATDIARRWGADEELAATEPDEIEALEDLVRDLAVLARSAAGSGRDLYVWISL
jgi:hypothetical protein